MTNKKDPKQIIDERQGLLGGGSSEEQETVRQALAKKLAAPFHEAQSSEASPLDFKAKAAAHKAKVKALAPARRLERFQQLHLVEEKGVIPNLAAKSALFAPVQKGRRKFFREFVPVPVWGLPGVELAYQFEQLNQWDLNVYLLLGNYAKRRGENFAAFTRSEALKALHMNNSGFSYKVFDASINRLGSTRIQIGVSATEQGDRRYVLRSALAPRDYHESREGLYVVELSTALQGFFAVDDWTLISLSQRLELGQNQWALAVHAFLVANKPPAWFTWDQIHFLWGQGYMDLKTLRKDFRRRVLKPLYDIGFINKVEEKTGNEKNPSGSIGIWCN